MALRLCEAQHDVTISVRSSRPVERMEAAGARVEGSPKDVVANSEITFLCLPDDEAVTSVVRGCLPEVAGRTVVDCSTVAPPTEVLLDGEVRAAGGSYLDAPVSGGPNGARAGTLAVMAGGTRATFEHVAPAVHAFGSYIDHVGPIGSGQLVKLCNQAIVGAQLLAIAECVELVRRSGVAADRLFGSILHSTADCTMARTRFPVPGVVTDSPASNDWRPDFTTNLMAKDLRIAGDAADASRDAGNAARDWSSFAPLLALDEWRTSTPDN
jgi:3-hydroxyisobutyrate dehydrogenase